MGNIKASITGIQGWVPDYVLTNAELEKMVDTNDEWIKSRTGISERRILKDPDKAVAYMGEQAIRGLLEKTNTDPSEIDLLICATVTEDMSFPDTATTILYNIGATNAYGFDVHAACSGFLYTMTTGAQFILSGMAKKVIVLGSDKMSAITDYTDRSTCILFGDAAGAVLLEPATDGSGLIDSYLRGDGSGGQYLYRKSGGSLNPPTIENVKNKEHFLFQDGRPVFKAAVNGMAGAIKEVLSRNNLTVEDIAWVAPHQANMRILQSVANQLDISMDKVMINIQKYGNTTSATIPLCLWEWENKLNKGDKIILTAFGGGYTYGASLWEWGY